ncbi:MAG: cytochrome c-type biogenesis protein CcmH [Gemmatimonadetes bacterium]|jgi:hypothetical protein|nr:cytochrome c-type biogenesis protein CcmH [Gemmatimonadota bacterium]
MIRRRTAVMTTALFAFGFTSVAAQSTGPSHAGYDPNAPRDGHVHVGDLGEKLLILESALKCDCGCGLDVHTCQFTMQCATSPGWSKRIRDSLAEGGSVDAIQAGFVTDFGTTVLMAPAPEGFNLVGYLLPGIAILTAGMLVGLVTRRGSNGSLLVPVDAPTDDQTARLRAAMRKLDESESPDW